MSKRVLVVTPWFPSARRPGAGAFILRDVEMLATSHQVTVLHLADQADVHPSEFLDEQTMAGATVVRQRFSSLSPRSLVQAGRAVHNRLNDAEVVHTMALHALMPVRLASPQIPWVHTEHWSGLLHASLTAKKRLGLLAYRSSLSRPTVVVAVSDVLAQAVNLYTRSPALIIPNGVELGRSGRLPDAPEFRGQGPLRLVGVGNLIHHKGPMQALETVAELIGRGVPATLRWIGSGPLMNELAQRSDELSIAESVRFVGQVDPVEVSQYLREAHVFLLPTISETFGVAIAEALAQGLPVVTTGRGGHLDFLPLGASRVAEARTASALADAVESLLHDEQRWRAERIADYAQMKFSEESRRAAYRSVYEAL